MTKFTRKEFLRLAGAAATASMTGGAAFAAQQSGESRTSGSTAPTRTLIRGADLLTMDTRQGEILGMDVLVENGRIAQIGKALRASDAAVVDARNMILMPGMIDGHRHTWQSILSGLLVKTSKRYSSYFEFVNMKVGVAYRPEDVYLGNYLGGLAAIDSGVTTIVDHSHISHTEEKAEASARGLKDSGVAGFSCYQISYTPSYGPRAPIQGKKAWGEFFAGPDDWHLKHAVTVRDKYFSSSADPLQFGVALSHVEYGPRTIESVHKELRDARKLEAGLMTQHIQGFNGDRSMGLPASYRVIADLHRAGLLGDDYHLSHGNGLTNDELKMLRDAGAGIASTTMGEYAYEWPSIHGRAHLNGVPVGIGIDVPVAITNDYFEHVRSAFWTLHLLPEGRKLAASFESADALNFATLGGARAIGLDSEIGSISVGKRADLVLLSTNRFGFPSAGSLADRVVSFASSQDIDSVWVAGRRRKAGGRLLDFDWAAMRTRADAAREYVVAQAGLIEFTS